MEQACSALYVQGDREGQEPAIRNVNFPDLPDSEIKGARFTHLCSNVFEIESYYKISDCEYGIPSGDILIQTSKTAM